MGLQSIFQLKLIQIRTKIEEKISAADSWNYMYLIIYLVFAAMLYDHESNNVIQEHWIII